MMDKISIKQIIIAYLDGESKKFIGKKLEIGGKVFKVVTITGEEIVNVFLDDEKGNRRTISRNINKDNRR